MAARLCTAKSIGDSGNCSGRSPTIKVRRYFFSLSTRAREPLAALEKKKIQDGVPPEREDRKPSPFLARPSDTSTIRSMIRSGVFHFNTSLPASIP